MKSTQLIKTPKRLYVITMSRTRFRISGSIVDFEQALKGMKSTQLIKTPKRLYVITMSRTRFRVSGSIVDFEQALLTDWVTFVTKCDTT